MVFSTPVFWMPTPLESSKALNLNKVSLPGALIALGVILLKRSIIAHKNQTASLDSALDYRVPGCKNVCNWHS